MHKIITKQMIIEGMGRYPQFRSVFIHALVLLTESDYRASKASEASLTSVQPTYPPLVELLAEAIRDDPTLQEDQ